MKVFVSIILSSRSVAPTLGNRSEGYQINLDGGVHVGKVSKGQSLLFANKLTLPATLQPASNSPLPPQSPPAPNSVLISL